MKFRLKYIQIVFLKNFFKLLWNNIASKILLVADILGLILALFPAISISPCLFLCINGFVIVITSIIIFHRKQYRIISTPEATLLEHTYHINALALSPNEKNLASCGGDHYAILWNLNTRKIVFRMQHDSWVGNIGFSPDNDFLYTLIGKNGTILQWNLDTQEKIYKKTWHKNQTRGLSISKTGHRAAISCKDGTFSYFDPTEKDFYTLPYKVSDVELRKIVISHTDLIATADINGRIYLIDPFHPSGSLEMTIVYEDPNKEMIRNLSFNAKGDTLAFTDSGGYLKIFDITTKRIISVKAHNGHAIGLAYHSIDRLIATGGQDNIIYVWKLVQDHLVKHCEIHGHTNDVTGLVFSKDMHLYSCSRDSTIKIWNLDGLS